MTAKTQPAGKCTICGVELPADMPRGICPTCALREALHGVAGGASGELLDLADIPLPPGKSTGGNGEVPEGTDREKTVVLSFPELEKPGDRIGTYKLLQQIGEGGCGVVYMAEQEEPVRRRVALKVIKAGMDTRQVLARFEAERQALALMSHPNIAKVLEAGATATGRPFFVMELVKGIPITRFCDENRYNTRQRLDLFIQVCQAVQHAHQKGIIHRDIKPSNILVADYDGKAVPKVIDFGLAKATNDQPLTDKTLFTAFEQFVGTPAYMSPEQAKLSGLDIDTRTDIYSLGVLLYELLTGKTPFDNKHLVEAGLDEIRRIIREDEPPRPSTRLSTLDVSEQTEVAKRRKSEPLRLCHLVKGDLDWIVMKTLEKERTRRYETVNGLAKDITRHLNNEPVLAAAPTTIYKFGKFARRNKAALLVCSIVILSLVVAAVAAWSALRSQRASMEARLEVNRVREVGRIETNRLMQAQLYQLAQMVLKGDTFASAEIRQRQVAAMVQALANDAAKRGIDDATTKGLRILLPPDKQYAEVDRFFANLLTAMPTNETPANKAQILRSRGAFRAQHGRWTDAAADLAAAVQVEPAEHWNWFLLAPVLVQTGDSVSYQNHCAAMLARFGSTTDLAVAERTAKVSLLLPLGRDLQAKATGLAEGAVSTGENHPYFSFFQFAIGLADYRSSEFQGAAERMRSVLAVGNLGTYLRVQALAVLAMGDEHLQNHDQARESLLQAIELSDSSLPPMDGGDLGSSWHDVLIADLLTREAKALVATNDFAPKQLARLLRSNGFLEARRGQWKQAISHIRQAIAITPTDHLPYHDLAALLVITHDLESYRKHCQDELLQFRQTRDASTAHRMAKDCLILADSGADFEVAREWTDTSLRAGAGSWGQPAFLFTKALAEYRIGELENAAQHARESRDIVANWPDLEVEINALLAMAQFRLGQRTDAHESLIRAKELVATKLPSPESKDLGAGWVDWIISRQLVQEASSIIESRQAR